MSESAPIPKLSFASAPAPPVPSALATLTFSGEAFLPGPLRADAERPGHVLEISGPDAAVAQRLLLLGVGERRNLDGLGVERVVASACRQLVGSGVRSLSIDLRGLHSGLGGHAALGMRLAHYAYTTFLRADRHVAGVETVTVRVDDPDAAEAAWAELQPYADASAIVRDLVNAPPNHLYPESFAARLQALAPPGLGVEVLDEAAMAALGMEALLSVGAGSSRPSRLVVLSWTGSPLSEAAPIALVGKGVCFDSGGLSLKTVGGMRMMKVDMAGAAVVAGALVSLAARRAPLNAVGVLGLVENMPDGNASRPGDIVRAMSGRTIEIVNTDCEGRIVLADALHYARTRFAPRALVDVATLTDGVGLALGTDYAGLFANDDALAQALRRAAASVDEPLWRLPLARDLAVRDAEIADLKQDWDGAGATVAATFLEAFVGDTPWAHLDIARVAYSDTARDPRFGAGPTAFGLRLLDAWLRGLEAEPH